MEFYRVREDRVTQILCRLLLDSFDSFILCKIILWSVIIFQWSLLRLRQHCLDASSLLWRSDENQYQTNILFIDWIYFTIWGHLLFFMYIKGLEKGLDRDCWIVHIGNTSPGRMCRIRTVKYYYNSTQHEGLQLLPTDLLGTHTLHISILNL